ncbi:hypothetical protein J18TS1_00300 [Oceanobacillus oncorhynchi subsp. incaldanensis]|nr:hypothetical protein J18TS1_00300 [Oceanobacillus oncorhynchi subsp. incaldanensis]
MSKDLALLAGYNFLKYRSGVLFVLQAYKKSHHSNGGFHYVLVSLEILNQKFFYKSISKL